MSLGRGSSAEEEMGKFGEMSRVRKPKEREETERRAEWRSIFPTWDHPVQLCPTSRSAGATTPICFKFAKGEPEIGI